MDSQDPKMPEPKPFGPLATPLPLDGAVIENRFQHHPPFGDQIQRYQLLRESAKVLAHQMNAACPPSRELSTAFTKLQEVVMWANAAIAINEEATPSPPAGGVRNGG